MNQALLVFLGVLVFIFTRTNAISSCGGYIQTSKDSRGVMSSGNYSGHYDNNHHCVWLLEGGLHHDVIVTINGFHGNEFSDTPCGDFIEVRAGSSSSPLLFKTCNETEAVSVRGRWLWVRFFSNKENVTAGFNASWWSVETDEASNNQSNPLSRCPWTRYSCSNHECISWSWVCDGVNDCGCTVGCDEDSCLGFGISPRSSLIIGICIGTVIFVAVIAIIVLWERHVKYRAKKDDADRRKGAARIKRQKEVEKTYNDFRRKQLAAAARAEDRERKIELYAITDNSSVGTKDISNQDGNTDGRSDDSKDAETKSVMQHENTPATIGQSSSRDVCIKAIDADNSDVIVPSGSGGKTMASTSGVDSLPDNKSKTCRPKGSRNKVSDSSRESPETKSSQCSVTKEKERSQRPRKISPSEPLAASVNIPRTQRDKFASSIEEESSVSSEKSRVISENNHTNRPHSSIVKTPLDSSENNQATRPHSSGVQRSRKGSRVSVLSSPMCWSSDADLSNSPGNGIEEDKL